MRPWSPRFGPDTFNHVPGWKTLAHVQDIASLCLGRGWSWPFQYSDSEEDQLPGVDRGAPAATGLALLAYQPDEDSDTAVDSSDAATTEQVVFIIVVIRLAFIATLIHLILFLGLFLFLGF